ncbi:hypothetical protein K4F52_006105 [Lecanicillium sp. MT-2017a]|nr:hypothetical protein K4F52_006105 [Lecanicillium sp. MT-2017a]
MRPSQIFKALGSIRWRYSTIIRRMGAGQRPNNFSSFHGGDGHPKEHVTVEFKDGEGKHVTTHHVRGPNDAK